MKWGGGTFEKYFNNNQSHSTQMPPDAKFFQKSGGHISKKIFLYKSFRKIFGYVALKKGHCIRKARGKTQGISIPPYYWAPISSKSCPHKASKFACSILGGKHNISFCPKNSIISNYFAFIIMISIHLKLNYKINWLRKIKVTTHKKIRFILV